LETEQKNGEGLWQGVRKNNATRNAFSFYGSIFGRQVLTNDGSSLSLDPTEYCYSAYRKMTQKASIYGVSMELGSAG